MVESGNISGEGKGGLGEGLPEDDPRPRKWLGFSHFVALVLSLVHLTVRIRVATDFFQRP